ncbi:extracellular solute-binding protein [Zongyangia hominis]|uniref:Extracellular solute-binding protein n=1 Tax=Zongyangia hominis TaxID=2763677 RepID=A0A926EAX2_9FIRM|nr:extracellular solute-binding protein [Zongyangia hominis]MBC8571160.1 extracellular solute-binding protein [Zongyangia hominis]
MKFSVLRKLALVMALVLLFLTGCQSGGANKYKLSPKDPVSLEIWHYYNGPQKVAFDALVSEFNETVGAEQGIVVEAFNYGSINELIQKVLDSANKKVGSSEMPDIFAGYSDTAYQVDQLGLVAPLDAYLTEEELKTYLPSYLEEGRFDKDQNLKIFPTAKSTEVMMLNKTDWDNFASATGAKVEDLSTMEGVVQTAKAYYEWSGGTKAFFGRDAMANYFIIGCKELGVEIFSVNNGEVSLNVDKKVIRKLWDNYYVPYVNGYFGAYGKFRSDDAKTGQIIALVGSTTGAIYFPQEVTVSDTESYPIEVMTLPAPVFEGGEPYAVQQGAGLVVTKSDERKEYAATLFLKWFTESQRNIDFSVGTGYLPVKVDANDMAMIEKSDVEMTDIMQETLQVAIDTVTTHEMYTNKAFAGGTEARNVLENSLQDKANADLDQIKALMEQGMSHDEAVAQFDTDANFDAWFAEFQKALEGAIK